MISKLTLDALKKRTNAVASEDLLSQISGGTDNDCHDEAEHPTNETVKDVIPTWPEPKPIILKGD